MKRIPTPFPELLLFEPHILIDDRGCFLETFQKQRYNEWGIQDEFVQDNFSNSKKNVIRGLHYQKQPYAQGKLVSVLRGQVLDVVVDIRLGSPTFGKSFSFILDDVTRRQAYVPIGFAHGFCVLSEEAEFTYKCTAYYNPASERGILWSDPDLKIEWPIKQGLLSKKDELFPTLRNTPNEDLPLFEKRSNKK